MHFGTNLNSTKHPFPFLFCSSNRWYTLLICLGLANKPWLFTSSSKKLVVEKEITNNLYSVHWESITKLMFYLIKQVFCLRRRGCTGKQNAKAMVVMSYVTRRYLTGQTWALRKLRRTIYFPHILLIVNCFVSNDFGAWEYSCSYEYIELNMSYETAIAQTTLWPSG